jgi:hypothetical protein
MLRRVLAMQEKVRKPAPEKVARLTVLRETSILTRCSAPQTLTRAVVVCVRRRAGRERKFLPPTRRNGWVSFFSPPNSNLDVAPGQGHY